MLCQIVREESNGALKLRYGTDSWHSWRLDFETIDKLGGRELREASGNLRPGESIEVTLELKPRVVELETESKTNVRSLLRR